MHEINGTFPELGSESLDQPSPAQHRSAFFPNSHNFVVSGGEFTNVTNIYTPSLSSRPDFRMLPLGDLDLRQEINGSVVNIRRRRGYTKRIYSARIDGRKSDVTVSIYEGTAAEEVWSHELRKHSKLRHPNLVQVYAVASSNGLYATVFHDELIPLKDTLKLYQNSPISTVYLLGIFAMDVYDADDYFNSVTGEWLDLNNTLWIRASTGRLCVELTPSDEHYAPLFSTVWADRFPVSLLKSLDESMIISSLTLKQYQRICSSYLALGQSVPIMPGETVKLGVIMSTSGNPHLDNLVEVAHATVQTLDDSGWMLNVRSDGNSPKPLVMGNGWTRFDSGQMMNANLNRSIDCRRSMENSWLSQANHIFNRLRVTSDYNNYVMLTYVCYSVILRRTQENIPLGYLFVCPLHDLQAKGDAMQFRNPEQLAYWALDPSGAARLSPEEAERSGFPALLLCADVWESCWDEYVYAGLRKFHEGKGFDPYSQDVARYLGVPLYQLSAERTHLFAHVEEIDSVTEIGAGDAAKAAPHHGSGRKTDSDGFDTDYRWDSPPVTPQYQHMRHVPHTILQLGSLGILLALPLVWLYGSKT